MDSLPLAATADRTRAVRFGVATGYHTGVSLPGVPSVIAAVSARLVAEGIVAYAPTAVTVNEYQPGQGIAAHVDRPSAGPLVTIVGLLSDGELVLSRDGREIAVPFRRRMLVQLSGEARTRWHHAIRPVTRRRIGLVFRRPE